MKTVLLVCTGNTCRSSMAEALLRDLLDKAGLSNQLEVKSAGTHGVAGEKANPLAVSVLADKWQLDLSKHAVTPITPNILATTDLILTMSNQHKSYLQTINPEVSDRVFTLAEFAGNPGQDIADPIGLGRSEYERVATQIYQHLTASLPIIRDFLNLEEEHE